MSGAKNHNLIDETIHQRTRLAIMSMLSGVKRLEFNEIKAELNLTDGNCSTHLASLEKAGYVKIVKSFRKKKPITRVSITSTGRKAMSRYVQLLKSILDDAGSKPKGE